MKKILGTTLVAIALAMVSTVDAKRMVRREVAPAPTKTELKGMVQDSKSLLDPAVSMAEKKQIATGLLGDLEAAGLVEYAKLLVERKKIANDLEAAKAERDATATGWLFDSAERKAANDKVADFNSKLRDINKQIRGMEADQPRETSNTAKLVVASVVATVGVIAAMEFYFRGEESIVRAGARRIGTAGGTVRTGYKKVAPKFLGGE